MTRRILVTGASIAGNTVAWWLGRAGFDVTVVERAPAFRDGGQNVDARGFGREVLRRMDLEQAALDLDTCEEGTAWIDAQGRIKAQILIGELGSDGPTAELEILRDDLARLIYEPATMRATYRFGDAVSLIRQDRDGVTVTFVSGMAQRYDAVVVAEGVGSTTRRLVFPHENDPRWMNLTLAYYSIPRRDHDDQMWRWYNAPGGISIALRPDRHGTTRAVLSVQHAPDGEQNWDADRQKAWLRTRFANAGWQSQRVLDALDHTKDFYFDVLRQVRMKRWSSGRIALTGDAAWCVTPIGGFGTTLALTGACVLAGEMACTADPAAAFAAYEQAMRPMVARAQGVPKIVPRLMSPQGRLGIWLLHRALRLAFSPVARPLIGKFSAARFETPDLSRYGP